jgi:hypothetical protein
LAEAKEAEATAAREDAMRGTGGRGGGAFGGLLGVGKGDGSGGGGLEWEQGVEDALEELKKAEGGKVVGLVSVSSFLCVLTLKQRAKR